MRVPETRARTDFWADLRGSTQARIGLGRAGDGLPTGSVLDFRQAHAIARDAVHDPLDVGELAARIEDVGLGRPVLVRSQAADRAQYLRRPDLGRRPADLGPILEHRTAVPGASGHGAAGDGVGAVGAGDTGDGDGNGGNGAGCDYDVYDYDVGFVLADGLSARALAGHGPATLAALVAALPEALSLAAPVIATQARVALGDHIGLALRVRTVIVLIGERPGLSVADSLGLYLTHRPEPGRTDAERNCVSNIHPPEGLGYAAAAQVISALVLAARALGRSGVELKDRSRECALPPPLT